TTTHRPKGGNCERLRARGPPAHVPGDGPRGGGRAPATSCAPRAHHAVRALPPCRRQPVSRRASRPVRLTGPSTVRKLEQVQDAIGGRGTGGRFPALACLGARTSWRVRRTPATTWH